MNAGVEVSSFASTFFARATCSGEISWSGTGTFSERTANDGDTTGRSSGSFARMVADSAWPMRTGSVSPGCSAAERTSTWFTSPAQPSPKSEKKSGPSRARRSVCSTAGKSAPNSSSCPNVATCIAKLVSDARGVPVAASRKSTMGSASSVGPAGATMSGFCLPGLKRTVPSRMW